MGIPRGQRGHVNRLRLISRAGPPQRCSGTTPGGPSPGQRADLDSLDQLWEGGGLEKLSEGGKEDVPLLPLLPSLVVHQGLDFVHQLASYLQDMLDVVTLSHLCR